MIITSSPYNVDIHYNSRADDLTCEDYSAEEGQKENKKVEWREKLKDIFPSRDIDRRNIKLDGFEDYSKNYQERDFAKGKRKSL